MSIAILSHRAHVFSKRCRNCSTVVVQVTKDDGSVFCWAHLLFPGEKIECTNPYPLKSEIEELTIGYKNDS